MSNSSIEKCACDEPESAQESDSSTETKERKSKISLSALGLHLRRGRSLHFTSKRPKKNQEEGASGISSLNTAIKKLPKWGLKFNCVKRETKAISNVESQNCCRCTCYRKKAESEVGECSKGSEVVCGENGVENGEPSDVSDRALVQADDANVAADDRGSGIYGSSGMALAPAVFDAQFLHVDCISSIHEDCDEQARMQRAREMEQGVEVPASFRQVRRVQVLCSEMDNDNGQGPRRLQLVCPPDLTVDSLRALFQKHVTVRSCPLDAYAGCHTQVDFMHCLVPDLLAITNCSFYWGKMDRYEAERLLDGKPEGTFLLRDSAQEEFLFSVSFRKYGRSLHARIEQWNHKFSFDSHDPNVFTSDTVCGLIEHYKDPSSCMFFEPMLTRPLHRNFTFPLQHLCRAAIVSRLTYDNINQLQLPKTLKSYLKEYHYRQKVRVERFDDDMDWLDLRNILS